MKHFSVVGNTLIKREKESAKLRMAGGAWSINLDDMPENVSSFEYITEKGKYTITRDDAFISGFERFMQGETKLVVPIKNWTFTPNGK